MTLNVTQSRAASAIANRADLWDRELRALVPSEELLDDPATSQLLDDVQLAFDDLRRHLRLLIDEPPVCAGDTEIVTHRAAVPWRAVE
jgi:hypothetical protein